jgi:hypothetical protein
MEAAERLNSPVDTRVCYLFTREQIGVSAIEILGRT